MRIEVEEVEFNADKCRNVFNREKKQAIIAVKELYGDNISKEKAEAAKEELGEQVYRESLTEIRRFNKEVSKRIDRIVLGEVFGEAEFRKTLNTLGVTLDHAMRQFNWNNPVLDYIEEVQ